MRSKLISFVLPCILWTILFFQNSTAFCQPVISSFSPASGGRYTNITINGNNFVNVTGVSFGEVPANFFFVISPTMISAYVDTGASGNIKVQASAGTASIAGFTFLPAPVISSFTPSTGSLGTPVAIRGKYFSNTDAVSFGNYAAQSYTVQSDTLINAVVGAGSSGYVSVSGPGGYGSLSGFTHLGPALLSYSPTRGSAGTIVTLKGTHLSSVNKITFQDQPEASFTILSDTIIHVVTAAGAYGTIMATSPSGSSILGGFNLPTVTGISSRSGIYRSTDTIKGRNFTAATAVKFGDTAAASYSILSDSVIVAIVGLGSSGYVQVYNQYGTGTSAAYFSFTQQAPALYSFLPKSGGMGTVVTIKGNHLSGSSAYFGNHNAAAISILSDTLLKATVADGATGIIAIYNQAGQAYSTDTFTYTGPVLLSFTPASGSEGDTILISGTNLNGISNASFGNTPAKYFKSISSTQLKAMVGNGSSGNITVTTPLGTGSIFGFTMKPKITSFSPVNAGADSIVLIKGRFLTGVYIVSFGGVNSTHLTVLSDSLVSATVPAHAYSGNIVVTSFGGTATLGGFTFIPVPQISGFSPRAGGVDTVITIAGRFFNWTTGVSVGGTPVVSFNIVNDELIQAKLGQGSSGSVEVFSGGGSASFAGFYYFGKPKITSFTPTKGGPMDIISIRGTNLNGQRVNGFGSVEGYTRIRFGGIESPTYLSKSDTLINVYLTANATGRLVLETPGGKDSMAGFTYQPVPLISSFNPASAKAGDAITIVGKNFSPAAQNNIVYFGGTRATVTSSSATSIQVIVPAGATFEPVSVTVDTKSGYSKKPYPVIYPGSENFSSRSYSTKIDLPLGYKPVTRLGDINGDGKLDMVVCDREHAKINIYINNSTPAIILFKPAVSISAGVDPKLYAVKDIDGDGKLDILFMDDNEPYFSGHLRILKNTGTTNTISFTLIEQSGILEQISAFNLCDFNLDGRPDMIFPSTYYTTMGAQFIHNALNQTLPGSGLLNFARENMIPVNNGVKDDTHYGYAFLTEITDFDNDGKPDVLVGVGDDNPYYHAHYFTILHNTNPSPGLPYPYMSKINVPFPNSNTYGPSSGDLNLDSLPDIICDTVALINSGNLNFTRQTNPCPGFNFIDDMDGDGSPDLGKLASDTFTIIRNKSINGKVVLSTKTSFYAGANSSAYLTGDLDGDGKPEIIVSRFADSTISFLRNKAGENISLCPGGSTSMTSNLTGSTYQWQLNIGQGFVNITDNATYSGIHSKTLQLTNMAESANDYQYRCLVDARYSYAFSLKVENSWTGSVNNAWENAANWSCNKVPLPGSNVIINSGTPVINSNVQIGSLTMMPDAKLTVNTGYTLTITH